MHHRCCWNHDQNTSEPTLINITGIIKNIFIKEYYSPVLMPSLYRVTVSCCWLKVQITMKLPVGCQWTQFRVQLVPVWNMNKWSSDSAISSCLLCFDLHATKQWYLPLLCLLSDCVWFDLCSTTHCSLSRDHSARRDQWFFVNDDKNDDENILNYRRRD